MKYEVVDRKELVKRLGSMCSPDPNREWYVIGPTSDGSRVCHIASCFNRHDAMQCVEGKEKNDG